MTRFTEVFGASKPVIAMVQLGALPGDPAATMRPVEARAESLADARGRPARPPGRRLRDGRPARERSTGRTTSMALGYSAGPQPGNEVASRRCHGGPLPWAGEALTEENQWQAHANEFLVFGRRAGAHATIAGPGGGPG